MDQYQHTAGHADSQPGDTDEGGDFVLLQAPESHFEIVSKQVDWFFRRRRTAKA